MKYKELELTEFYSDKSVLFEPKRTMCCWNYKEEVVLRDDVIAYIPDRGTRCVVCSNVDYEHCAEAPANIRLATVNEINMWLGTGFGVCKHLSKLSEDYGYITDELVLNMHEAIADYRIQRKDETEWQQPTYDVICEDLKKYSMRAYDKTGSVKLTDGQKHCKYCHTSTESIDREGGFRFKNLAICPNEPDEFSLALTNTNQIEAFAKYEGAGMISRSINYCPICGRRLWDDK